MDISIFSEKEKKPTIDDLKQALNSKFKMWEKIRNMVLEKYPKTVEEWNYPGKKYGWSFRMKDKKRAIIYLLPRDCFFQVAFVFGQKATDEVMESDISEEIKTELKNARVYAEGRGIRIPINDEEQLSDIETLVDIKLRN